MTYLIIAMVGRRLAPDGRLVPHRGTGTDAVANGVPVFKPPEPRDAAATPTFVALLLAALFLGITFVVDSYGIVVVDEPATRTVIQPGRRGRVRRRLGRL